MAGGMGTVENLWNLGLGSRVNKECMKLLLSIRAHLKLEAKR